MDLFEDDSETTASDFDESAKQIYKQFDSFCKAGFSELQSMQLVMTILHSTITKPNNTSGIPPMSF